MKEELSKPAELLLSPFEFLIITTAILFVLFLFHIFRKWLCEMFSIDKEIQRLRNENSELKNKINAKNNRPNL